ncbi:hypothetical protein ZIOFF_024467 [Zingiber officinale]|uniref:F-box domain-containing protein n=1 Tax=Zingiber officinale TaxID=94328 RepID=A0A8J5LG71_ZINOF|nr:hypothetical protein ZIOFF_024467 [Zingiber officinale]
MSMIQDMRDEFGSISRKGFEMKLGYGLRSRSHRLIHDAVDLPLADGMSQSCWENMPPELLMEVLIRIEEADGSWPLRKGVVACAGVCRSWRSIMKDIVKTPEVSGKLTFPISVKQKLGLPLHFGVGSYCITLTYLLTSFIQLQPGPRDFPLQCFIRRNRNTQTYHLYLGLTQDQC